MCETCLLACDAQVWSPGQWSMVKVNVMRVCANELEAVKDECHVLIEGLEKQGD